MGVRGLETFLEKCCGTACYNVSIEQLVEQYKEKYNGRPVIAVDASSCLRHLYGKLEWLYGGAHKDFRDIVLAFVKSFQALDINLIFFFDGPTVERKRNVWIERRLSNGLDKLKLFDTINNQQIPSEEELRREFFQLPSDIRSTFQYVVRHDCECEVRRSIRECDEEIAAFARENPCFAILGQDTDFVIFEGPLHYLSVKNLDVRTRRTRKYDRVKLAEVLRLTTAELPLLATLIGNDVVRLEQLQDFHSDVCKLERGRRPRYEVLFREVARYINGMLRQRKTVDKALPDIAREVFGDTSQVALLRTSVHSYYPGIDRWEPRPGIHWEQVLARGRLLHIQCKLSAHVWPVMSGSPYDFSGAIEDYRLNDLPLSGPATLPMRQRTYGILLQEKPAETPGSPTTVPEWIMAGPSSLDAINCVPIVSPPAAHCGLLLLWDGDDPHLVDLRWKLFAWGVSPKLDPNTLRQLQPHLVVPTMALFYIQRELARDLVETWEMRALVATCVTFDRYVEEHRHLFKPIYNVRGIRLAALFEKVAQSVGFLLSICGYPITRAESILLKFFDGRVFSLLYNYACGGISDDDICLKQEQCTSEFQLMMNIINNQPDG